MVNVLGEKVGNQGGQVASHGAELLGEFRYLEARVDAPLFGQTRERPLPGHVDQFLQMLVEQVGALVGTGHERQGEPPDLTTLLVAQIAEHLDEAGDEVALGDEQIHRHDHVETTGDLVQAIAQRLGKRRDLVFAAFEIEQADRQQDAIDRLSRTRLAQQIQKRQPLLVIVVLGDQRPAVSRMMASLVSHQLQLRVPPTPLTLPPFA